MAALAILVFVSAIGAVLVRAAVAAIDADRQAERRLQARWLLESAAERASRRLRDDPDYVGETWNPPPAVLGGRANARLEIKVERVDSGGRRLRIECDYGPSLVRVEKVYALPPRSEPKPSTSGDG